VLKAKLLLDREDYEKALRAALYVTIFFSDERFDVSRALLIAGECYLNMGDRQRTVRTYYDVVHSFPGTASATAAQNEISKGGEAFAVIVKALEAKDKEAQSKLAAGPQQAATPTPTPKP
jgi:hypothetical protein